MKKRNIWFIICGCIIAIAMTITVFAASPASTDNNEPVATISEAYIPSEASTQETEIPEEEVIVLENVEVERVEPTTLNEANTALEDATFRNETAMAIYEGLLALGYTEDHPAVVLAATDIANTKADIEYYSEQQAIRQKEYEWQVRAEEYPAATEAWLYMKNEFGWSDTVCAGIIGNFMAECGGCWTQDLDWDVNTSHGLGMVQWIGGRRSQLIKIYGSNPSITDQLNFMRDELYGSNGVTKQVTDNQLDKIMNASSPEDCAYYFACYYERCAEQHRYPRKGYARTAYEYFVD